MKYVVETEVSIEGVAEMALWMPQNIFTDYEIQMTLNGDHFDVRGEFIDAADAGMFRMRW